MAADVGTGNTKQENEAKKVQLFTRDLLGGSASDAACASGETVEWEKRFDLLLGQRSRASGKTFRPINLNYPPPPPPSFSSVCTLEKVKSALDRASTKSNGSASSSSSSSPYKIKRSAEAEEGKTDGQDGEAVGGPMMISRCPKCMQYLMVFKVDPRCPSCDAHVPEPNYMMKKKNSDNNNTTMKKAKIDLNESVTDY